jgi:hypothetical protein
MRYAPRHAVRLDPPLLCKGHETPLLRKGHALRLDPPLLRKGHALRLDPPLLRKGHALRHDPPLLRKGHALPTAPFRSLRSIRGRHAVVMRFGLTRPYCGKGHALPSAPLGRYAVVMRSTCAPYLSVPLP